MQTNLKTLHTNKESKSFLRKRKYMYERKCVGGRAIISLCVVQNKKSNLQAKINGFKGDFSKRIVFQRIMDLQLLV